MAAGLHSDHGAASNAYEKTQPPSGHMTANVAPWSGVKPAGPLVITVSGERSASSMASDTGADALPARSTNFTNTDWMPRTGVSFHSSRRVTNGSWT